MAVQYTIKHIFIVLYFRAKQAILRYADFNYLKEEGTKINLLNSL